LFAAPADTSRFAEYCGLDSAGIGTFGGSCRESPSGEFQRAGQSAQHRGVLNASATIWDAQRFRETSASTGDFDL